MNETISNTAETEDDGRVNTQNVGAKILKATPGVETLISESADAKLDPFWEKHPDLFNEARELGAPLTAKDFKEQGFSFEKNADGEYHVLAPTPAYAEWKSSDDKENTAFRGYARENVGDRKNRSQKEELGSDNPENLKNKPWDDLIKDENVIRFVYDSLYPDGIKGGYKDGIIDKAIFDLRWSFPSENRMLKKIGERMTKEYGDAFARDEISLPVDDAEIVREVVAGQKNTGYYPTDAFRFRRQREEIMRKVASLQLDENLPQLIEKTRNNSADDREQGAYLALARGVFFPKTLAENPVALNAVFEELGIDKDSDRVTAEAIRGYALGKNKNKPGIKFFDLENKIVDLFEHDVDSKNHIFGVRDGVLNIKEHDSWLNSDREWKPVNPEISKKVMERIKVAEDGLIDKLNNNPDFEKTTKKEREKILEDEKHRVLDRLSSANVKHRKFDFGQYLDIKTLDIDGNGAITDFIDGIKSSERLGRFINTDDIRDALSIPDVEVGDMYKSAIREGLLQRLAKGIDTTPDRNKYNSWRLPDYHLTEIFETDEFKDNQERIGIDFEDSEIAEIAFDGFINTLNTTNGELSAQADWYYDNIFANDPGRFLEKVKALREQSGRGTKAKITRFLKHNPRAFQDKIKMEAEERFRKEIIGGKQKERISVLREAKRDDINKILDEYKEEIVDQIRGKNAEKIWTFDGLPTIRGIRMMNGGKEERKETPFDFGLEKGNALLKYGDFVEATFPDCNIHWFTDTFPTAAGNEVFDKGNSYIGFSFEFHGKLCVIAESLNNEAAMYLWRGKIGEDLNDDFRQMFDMARFDAKRSKDPRIVSVGHLDKEHFDDSLDETYQKAFLFFVTGRKSDVLYTAFGGKDGWERRRENVLGAWPLSVEHDYINYPEDLAGYHAWQQRQSEIQTRLRSAAEQGGQDAVKKELEKIAEEDYLAMYEGER